MALREAFETCTLTDNTKTDTECVAAAHPESTERNSPVVNTSRPSTLWGMLADAEIRESEGGNLSLHDVEVMHNVRPGSMSTQRTNRDPLKVKLHSNMYICFKYHILEITK